MREVIPNAMLGRLRALQEAFERHALVCVVFSLVGVRRRQHAPPLEWPCFSHVETSWSRSFCFLDLDALLETEVYGAVPVDDDSTNFERYPAKHLVGHQPRGLAVVLAPAQLFSRPLPLHPPPSLCPDNT